MPALCDGQYVNVGSRRLLVQQELGSGAFGTVYKVYDSREGATYAVKDIPCENTASIGKVLREAQTLLAAKHERIVQIVGADKYQLPGDLHFLILTEFCSGGDLNSRLGKPSGVEKNLKWICQISEALNYLHSRNPAIVHRDLKADNVLLTDPITEDLKLGDFGLAREYVDMKYVGYSSESVETYYMNSGTGPIHWMAPEFFAERYTEKADIFSLGGIFHAILARDFHTFGSKKMYGVFASYRQHGKVGLGLAMANIDRSAVVQFPTSFQGSNSMKRLIEDMLQYDPHERPSAREVYERVKIARSSINLSNPNPDQAGVCC